MTWFATADNGLVYVRVGSAGAIQTNVDPGNPAYLWTNRTSGTADNLYGIAWNGTVFTTVGQNGTGLYSFEGVDWYPCSGEGVQDLHDIAALTNIMVAVGNAGTIIVSQNGEIFQSIASGTSEHLRGVTVGDSTYVAVGDNDTIVVGSLTSYDTQVSLLEGIFFNDPIPSLAGSTDSQTGDQSEAIWIAEDQVNLDYILGDGGTVDDSLSTDFDIALVEDVQVNENYTPETPEDVTSTDDSTTTSLDVVVTEDVWANDSYANQKNAEAEQRDVTEVAVLVEGLTAAEVGTVGGDGFSAYPENSYPMSLNDGMSAAETGTQGVVGAILTQTYQQVEQEGITASSAGTTNSWYAGASLVDSMYFYKFLGANDYSALIEAVTVTDSIPLTLESVVGGGGGSEVVIDAEPAGVWAALGFTVLDDVAFNEPLLEARAKFYQLEAEATTFNEVVLDTMTIGVVIPEGVQFDDTPTVNQILQLWLEEQAVLFTGFIDISGATYNGVVMNLRNKAITEYDAYDFNSLGYWQETSYGAKADGIYKLEGANDAGVDIAAHILTAITDFGYSPTSRVERAYLGVRNDGSLTLKVIARQDDDTKVAHLYDMTQVGSTLRRERVKLGKGVRAAYFQFELSNTAGGDFELDEMVLVPIALARRIT